MNNFSADVRKHAAIIILRNLPRDTSEENLSSFLWEQLGWNVAPEQLSVKNLEPPADSANCMCIITRATLCDFLGRALEGITFNDRALHVHQPQAKQ
jgi:hypothetical protein